MIAEQTSNRLYDPTVYFEPISYFSMRQVGFYSPVGEVAMDPHPLASSGYFPAIFNPISSPGLPTGGLDVIHAATIDAGPSLQYLVDDGYHYIITDSNRAQFILGYEELRTMSYSGLPVGMLDVVVSPDQANWIGSV